MSAGDHREIGDVAGFGEPVLEKPLFSVIIPTYDQRLLPEAVSSVLAQRIADLECIVVDDASPSPVGGFADSRVTVVRRDRQGGPAAARNTGLRLARGRYVCFLDDDDLYTPDRLNLALEGLQRAPVSVCWAGDPTGAVARRPELEGDLSDVILNRTPPPVGTAALERAVAPFFDERFGAAEDMEWWLRVAQAARITTVRRIGYLIRAHSGPPYWNVLGRTGRLYYQLLILQTHRSYFVDHPRAAAYQWTRVGLLARKLGDRSLARRALWRALAHQPQAKTVWHLALSLGFSRAQEVELAELLRDAMGSG